MKKDQEGKGLVKAWEWTGKKKNERVLRLGESKGRRWELTGRRKREAQRSAQKSVKGVVTWGTWDGGKGANKIAHSWGEATTGVRPAAKTQKAT